MEFIVSPPANSRRQSPSCKKVSQDRTKDPSAFSAGKSSAIFERPHPHLESVTAFTDIFSRLSENVFMEDLKMEKTTAGYRAFATRIVTRGTFTAEHAAHPRIKHTVERALLLTVVAVAFFLLAHH